jgi:hypothetical protein
MGWYKCYQLLYVFFRAIRSHKDSVFNVGDDVAELIC